MEIQRKYHSPVYDSTDFVQQFGCVAPIYKFVTRNFIWKHRITSCCLESCTKIITC